MKGFYFKNSLRHFIAQGVRIVSVVRIGFQNQLRRVFVEFFRPEKDRGVRISFPRLCDGVSECPVISQIRNAEEQIFIAD